MTRKEFIEALARTDLEWHLNRSGCIRTVARFDTSGGRACHCPVTAVLQSEKGERWPMWTYGVAGLELGLDIGLAEAIAAAADSPFAEDLALRQEMLTALGLEE